MNEVSHNIEKIKSIFLDTQEFYAKQNNINILIAYLENTEPAYRSIAYESASMAIALKGLENSEGLDAWLSFVKGPASAHKVQVHVGLGWAIAKLNIPFSSVAKKIEPRFHSRVADGCGYYDGNFRQRQTVLSQQLPIYLPGAAMAFYDQGVGRSLWYTNNADINKIRNKIESFPADRRPGLWRGIGIAVAYVGGCDEDTLRTLLEYAAMDRIQLASGAALAARSRMDAGTMTTDTDHCARLWFELTAAKKGNDDYYNWITQIEENLVSSFELPL